MKKLIPQNDRYNEFLLYKTSNGNIKVEIFLHDENIWLTQEKIALLFGVQRPAITKHLRNIFDNGELREEVASSILEHTTIHGAIKGKTQNQSVKFYNLDAILSVGYRVNSTQATQFRIWATERLKEYIIKGFTMDDERLKTPNYTFGQDYFEEQLERVKVIRSSADYAKNSVKAQNFFATVQNKFHFAITHQTAAEIIHNRVDGSKQNMGLTNWKNGPNGDIRKTDIGIAKNYLNKEEIERLNDIVEMYLIFAASQAKNRQAMYMQDWEKKLGEFLKLNDRDILDNLGKVSHDVALALAEKEFEKYSIEQDKKLVSDFDEYVAKLDKSKPKK
jgi:hypothetical protein